MSVIGKNKVIFCEGKQSSLDYSLLNRVVDDLPGAPTVVPAGSKFTFSVFAHGYFFPYETEAQQYVVFRDRDFDVKPTDNVQLLQLDEKENIALTYRACIENYLIDVNLIHEYVTQDSFKSSLKTYRDRFNQANFWSQKQYLIWFHGKDIQKAMQRQEPHYISLKAFFIWAVARLDLDQHPDLAELRTKIEQM